MAGLQAFGCKLAAYSLNLVSALLHFLTAPFQHRLWSPTEFSRHIFKSRFEIDVGAGSKDLTGKEHGAYHSNGPNLRVRAALHLAGCKKALKIVS